jgi:hypothetical protein
MRSIVMASCALDTNQASKGEGGSSTPRSFRAWNQRVHSARSQARAWSSVRTGSFTK